MVFFLKWKATTTLLLRIAHKETSSFFPFFGGEEGLKKRFAIFLSEMIITVSELFQSKDPAKITKAQAWLTQRRVQKPSSNYF